MAYLPVETVIKHRQADYYQRLGEADASSNCSAFIEFLLEAIDNQPVTNEKTRVEMQVKMRVETVLD